MPILTRYLPAKMTIIYKIMRNDEWRALLVHGATQGAPIDIQDGYIHFSTIETVRETARKYFANETGLKLLAYDADTLGAALVFEPSRGGLLFPHLYAALPLELMLWVKDLPWVDGDHQFPKDMA